jgi:tetratricopeptide (TPR) repeat protein
MNKLIIPILALVLLASCGNKKKFSEQIDKEEKALMAEAKTGNVDTAKVSKLLADYDAYATKYPDDTTGANYLFKAADFYRYLKQPLRSEALYERIYNNYPKYDKRPYALFLQGFIYENEVNNPEAAKAKYQQFLKEYPDHAIAKDVQMTLDNVGKSPEQMMEEFNARQEQDSLAAANGQ